VLQEIFNLLAVSESLLSRSSKDVFPFHLKHVELYRHLSKISSAVDSRLKSLTELASYISLDLQFLIDPLEELNRVIRKIVTNAGIHDLVIELEQIFAVFRDIRVILGQENKCGKSIKEAVERFLKSLECKNSLEEVYHVVKKRFKMYKNELYIAYDNDFVPRTNNDLEDFNNCLKRPIRKGQGKRESWFYVEHQGVPATYYHNLLNAPHVVGGAEISWTSERTPLERIGVLETISVSTIMKMINREYLYKCLAKNDKLYTVHRWTRRIFKQGLETCLNSLDCQWMNVMEMLMGEKKIIKGGKTSSS
jgi:hypothetical protein